ncbi:TPA: type III secretion system export apparatus subunit SctT [Salmonella enterica subsp. enterica serovar Bredeney]|uniref:EscT/YscT/HrcT family type III secretion system export apparatus protein n=3 Tax=Salmonella enterica TaxID=28901 RepID=A0A5I3EPU9_SALET|nr:type III secretion system export apparatus subunit SctT [Salmonella enterica]EAA2100260.1 EscT/YscT/HrcT family type III secretion system export apparatus protein [Salmonella enterica subsp. enterica serovar Bredeney]EAA7354153.1 EscT/YscT/HrcT family type III secretion system export apparatus protein [Salmonella enterica subsp. enterica]EAB7892624.1 EscT/YscT/HrcT family type III secretion system export apparatus protein [Salmonella enterica subsp. enterica serovar Newport]EBW5413663.1 EscT
MSIFSLYLEWEKNISYFFMIYARVAVVFFFLPVFGGRILSHIVIKNMTITLVIIGLWPCFDFSVVDAEEKTLVLCRESVTGLGLALIVCVPFWIATSIGELIDNQRGATISDSIDPVHGLQSSIFSSFLTFVYGVIFFQMGGVKQLVDVLAESYVLLPIGKSLSGANWRESGVLINSLIKESIILASPVMIVMMVSEVLLGVLSKYCPQMNPFSLSLTIKSILAFGIFFLYGMYALTHQNTDMHYISYAKYIFS